MSAARWRLGERRVQVSSTDFFFVTTGIDPVLHHSAVRQARCEGGLSAWMLGIGEATPFCEGLNPGMTSKDAELQGTANTLALRRPGLIISPRSYT
jgi:hypothetical protein